MGNGLLLVGNLVNLLIAIMASLEVLPWSIAGYLIIATTLIVTFGHVSSIRRSFEKTNDEMPASTRVIGHGLVPNQRRVPATLRAHETVEQEIQHERPSSIENPPSIDQQPTEPADSSTSISEGDFLSFEVKLEKGEEMVGEVSSNGQVNVYILNEENLTALESDQEFWYEAGNEGVKGAVLRFTAPEDGEWFLVVENVEAKEINAKARMTVTKAAHQVPLLKSESLDLPDARLEGKLRQ